jgi:hypothetical protein
MVYYVYLGAVSLCALVEEAVSKYVDWYGT